MTNEQAEAIRCFVAAAFGERTSVNWDGDPEERAERMVRLSLTANPTEGSFERRYTERGQKLREVLSEVRSPTISARLLCKDSGAWAGAIADAARVRMRRSSLLEILRVAGVSFVGVSSGARDFNFRQSARTLSGAVLEFRVRYHVVDDGTGTAGGDWIEDWEDKTPEVES